LEKTLDSKPLVVSFFLFFHPKPPGKKGDNSPQFPLFPLILTASCWCEAAKPGVAATSMPNLSRTKKVVKVLVVSEMNIASGATDMDFFVFFFKKKTAFLRVFFWPGFCWVYFHWKKNISQNFGRWKVLKSMEIPSVAFQRLLGSRKVR